MIVQGVKWDYVVKGREITRNLPLNAELPSSLIATVDGPRHDEFVEFAARLQKNAAPVVGLSFFIFHFISFYCRFIFICRFCFSLLIFIVFIIIRK